MALTKVLYRNLDTGGRWEFYLIEKGGKSRRTELKRFQRF